MKITYVKLDAADIGDWIPAAVKELKGRTGTKRYMRNNSPTIRGAHLALEDPEFQEFLEMVKEAQQIAKTDPRAT